MTEPEFLLRLPAGLTVGALIGRPDERPEHADPWWPWPQRTSGIRPMVGTTHCCSQWVVEGTRRCHAERMRVSHCRHAGGNGRDRAEP